MNLFKLKFWIQGFRFKTLTASLTPVMVATSLCWTLGIFKAWWISLCALFSAFCIQIATNFLNDIIDFKKGADNKKRLGPQRLVLKGFVQERQIWFMGFFFLFLACIFGFPLVVRGGIPILILGLISCFLAYGYTGGFLPLAYKGLGDLFVILFFGLFAVIGTGYLHSLDVNPVMITAGFQMGFLSTILIAINNLRDSQTDKIANKKTLAVRFGDTFVCLEILVFTILIYCLNIYYFFFLSKPYIMITLLSLPLGIFVVSQVYTIKEKRKLNKTLGFAVFHQLLFSFLFSLGVIL